MKRIKLFLALGALCAANAFAQTPDLTQIPPYKKEFDVNGGLRIAGSELKGVMDKEKLTFRSFTDTAAGEGLGVIGGAWNLFGTPTVFVLDHKGVIRFKNVRGEQLDAAVDQLVRECEADLGKK